MDHGWPEAEHGGGAHVFRPRPLTARTAALLCAALLVVSIASASRGLLWLAAVPFLFFVQCFQRVVVDGGRARRTGLRAVDLDLATARVRATGRPWWIELFFLGRCFELRDADGRGLLLESWLWSRATRDALAALVPPAPDGNADAPRS